MKSIVLLFLLILAVSCSTQKIISYEYSTVTRGYKKTTTITKKGITITENNETENTVIFSRTGSDLWKVLQVEGSKIELNKIANLDSPNNKRHVDAAMFSKISFRTKDSTYISSSFDNGNPPAELKIIVDSLVNLRPYGK